MTNNQRQDVWTYRLKRDRDWEQWVVVVSRNGKRYEPACYYTDDKDDAMGTLEDMQKGQQ